jgi:hypothetical protein
MGFFFAGDNKNVPPQLRQRLALALMAQKRKAPANLGEGLSAIGDSLGDIGMMRRLEREAAASEQAGQAAAAAYPGSAGAAPAAAKSYGDTGDVASPAVQAINEAISPPAAAARAVEPGPLTTAPAPGQGMQPAQPQPPSMLSPQPMLNKPIQTPPATAFTPNNQIPPPRGVPPQSGADGGYNMLDAQAGMPRMGQGRVQDTVMRVYPDNPDMQAYASQLNAAEQPTAGDTSSTGAAGPWQFTRGTARQYGLADPNNIEASGDALKKLTADNAATFERINGRPPTMADLATMHQQGGATGARMVAGTGNASPQNLAVNNVSPGAGPAAAAAKIKGFYGMPERPVDARDGITSTLVARNNPPPAASPMAFAGTPPPPSGIQAAPPAIPPIQKAPMQVAQAGPDIVPLPPKRDPPPLTTPGIDWINRKIATTPLADREAVAAALEPQMKLEQGKLAQAHEEYKNQLIQDRAIELEHYRQVYGAPKAAAETTHLQAQTRKEGIIEDPDAKFTVGPDGVARPLPIEGGSPDRPPPLPKNEFQLKSVKYAEQMQEAEKIVGEGSALRQKPSGIGSQLPVVGGYLQTDAYRRERSAAERWVFNKLRSESGATIRPDEIDKEVKAYFPLPSDDAKTIADKTAARKTATEGMVESSGREGKSYIEWKNKRAAAEETAKKGEIADAVQWLKDNPQDPRAASVRKRLGL